MLKATLNCNIQVYSQIQLTKSITFAEETSIISCELAFFKKAFTSAGSLDSHPRALANLKVHLMDGLPVAQLLSADPLDWYTLLKRSEILSSDINLNI